jgi:beta-lactamase superfamily II metal-dependent hydrolase
MLKLHILNTNTGCGCLIAPPSGNLSLYNAQGPPLTLKGGRSIIDFIKNTYPDKEVTSLYISFPSTQRMIGVNEIIKKVKTLHLPDLGSKENHRLKTLIEKKIDLRRKIYDHAQINFLSHIKEQNNSKSFSVLWPPKNNRTKEGLVIKVTLGRYSILLGGDTTVATWKKIIAHHGEEVLKSTVLHAPLHGKPRGMNTDILQIINPVYVIIPVIGNECVSSLYFGQNFHLYFSNSYESINLSFGNELTINTEKTANLKTQI